MPGRRLDRRIRCSGYYNVKARRVRAFLDCLDQEHAGRVERMAQEDPWGLRERLLEVDGIGPETADSIVLYAAGHPLFVVAPYTRPAFAPASVPAASIVGRPKLPPMNTGRPRRRLISPIKLVTVLLPLVPVIATIGASMKRAASSTSLTTGTPPCSA